jgi:predicted transcriptional regulator
MTDNKTKKPTRTRHTFFIDDDIYKELVDFADKEDRLISSVIRLAFKQFLESQKRT